MKKLLSFFNDNAKKYTILAIAAVILVGLIFACAKIGVTVGKSSNNATASNTSENKIEVPSDDFEVPEDEEEYALDLPTQFVPFACSGDYYSFENLKNQYGFAFETQHVSNKIVYIHNDEETVLLETDNANGNVSVSIHSYIDDNLFFSVRQGKTDTLYRMAFEYDGDGNILNSDIYFVAENVNWPVKALDNVLIIEKEYGEYVSFNTKTGEMTPIEYNKEVDAGSVKVSVTSDKAIKIAEKELEKDMYRVIVGGHEEHYIPNIDGIDPVLIHYPDLIYHGGYESHRYEDYPEYVWVVRYDTEFLYQQVRIYVNAMSGEISYVQIQPYP